MGIMISGAMRLLNLRLLAGGPPPAVPVTLSWVTDADLGVWADIPINVVATASNAAPVTYSFVAAVGDGVPLPNDVVFNATTGRFEGTQTEGGWGATITTVMRIQASTGSGIPITRDFILRFPSGTGN